MDPQIMQKAVSARASTPRAAWPRRGPPTACGFLCVGCADQRFLCVAQINSAREALQHAAMHEQKGLPASASTILTIGTQILRDTRRRRVPTRALAVLTRVWCVPEMVKISGL